MRIRNPPSPDARAHKKAHDREMYAATREVQRARRKERHTARKERPAVTHAQLISLFQYDPATGLFTRRIARGSRIAGEQAGTLLSDGYWQIAIDARCYAAHRLAWLYMTGKWPSEQIDHIDTDKGNNRFSNLRDVTETVNKQNIRKAPRGKKHSPLLGAHWNSAKQNWRSAIKVNGKIEALGVFRTDAEASSAYIEAKRLLHEGCTI